VTLLELLVTLALVGVLGGIAYPSYRQQVLRAHRLDAIEALLAVAAAQERFHIAHGRYAERFAAGSEPGLRLPPVTAGGRYELSVSVPEPESFIAAARPRHGSGQEADERCSELSIRADGARRALDRRGVDTTDACWG
jgi:type IV pilus assembly protein PilE